MRIVIFALLFAATLGSIELLDESGKRQGYIRESEGRLDIYDAKSRRTGYGVERPDGSWDIYNRDGTRRGTITPGDGGRPGRVMPKGKRQ